MRNSVIRVRDKDGVTLVEVMIALVVLLLVMMGLLQAALLSIDNNLRNIVRDEAVKIADAGSAELRNLPFDNAALGDTGGGFAAFPAIASAGDPGGDLTRDFRNFTRTFVRMIRIQNLDTNTKSVQVRVGWNYKNERPLLAPTGTEFQHSVTTVRRNQ